MNGREFKLVSLVAAILLWAAFPPLGLSFLAPLSIAIYLVIVLDEEPLTRSRYLYLWGTSFLMWLLLLQGIRLAYWPLYFGWIALCAYLAIYLPLSISLARHLRHTRRLPVSVAFIGGWLSCELIRGYFATGFSGCLLGHVFAKHPLWIQLASHLGPYIVSAKVILLGLIVARLSIFASRRWSTYVRGIAPSEALVALLCVVASLVYGSWELSRSSSSQAESLAKIALIQENAPTIFEANRERTIQSWDSYLERTRKVCNEHTSIDLVVWPESAFTRDSPYFEWDRSPTLPIALQQQNIGVQELTGIVASLTQENEAKARGLVKASIGNGNGQPAFLVGCDVHQITGPQYKRLNAAMWIDKNGVFGPYYAKQHLVMFGEYIPLASVLPFLYDWIRMQPAHPGSKSLSFTLETGGKKATEVSIAPSICFENMVPHLLRRQLREQTSHSRRPDIMINITNDGWFRGSSISDIHLQNAIFAAVENRLPMLVAANVGITAWIDGSGRVIDSAKRLQGGSVIAQPKRDSRSGLWTYFGDTPIRFVAIAVVGIVSLSFWKRRPTSRIAT